MSHLISEYQKSSCGKGLGFPPMGSYEHQSIQHAAQWLAVSASAADAQLFEYVLTQGDSSHHSGALSMPLPPFQDRVNQSMLNFSRLFEGGRSLMNKITPLDIADHPPFSSPLTFRIGSPKELLAANLGLMHLAEKIISQELFPTQGGELTKIQRFCLMRSQLLDPLMLSEMTEGNISIEDAMLLIPCLGLRKGKNKICVCDPSTGNFHKDFKNNMLAADYKLIFLDPEEQLASFAPPTYDPEKVARDTSLLFEGTKLMVCAVLGQLADLLTPLPAPEQQRLIKDLKRASIDHKKVRQIINQLEDYFPEDKREAIISKKAEINTATQASFEKCEELAASLLTQDSLDEQCKLVEARARLGKAKEKKAWLIEKFSNFKHVILRYLTESSKKYQILHPTTIHIHWIIQGTTIEETMDITKTCAIARRVLSSASTQTGRRDLVYFSTRGNEESIASCWNKLCREKNLTDRQLAQHLLSLYAGQQIPKELEQQPFLAFLIVLLLGKEPAYDAASLVSNTILLISVSLGISSFEEALRAMPLIPQGAMAAKQFLLHASGMPLDSIARVCYKDTKRIPKSNLLLTSSAFLGSANDWIQKYDDVASIALQCCQRYFIPEYQNPHLITLQEALSALFLRELDISEIPFFLSLRAERRALALNPEDQIAQIRSEQKKALAQSFLKSVGQPADDPDQAVDQCIAFLTQGIDSQDPAIKQLQALADQQDHETWKSHILGPFRDEPFYQDIENLVNAWNPYTAFISDHIDPFDSSQKSIFQMNKTWENHCAQYIPPEQQADELKQFLLLNYRTPVPFSDLAAILDPEISSDDDPFAGWAISYLLQKMKGKIGL